MDEKTGKKKERTKTRKTERWKERTKTRKTERWKEIKIERKKTAKTKQRNETIRHKTKKSKQQRLQKRNKDSNSTNTTYDKNDSDSDSDNSPFDERNSNNLNERRKVRNKLTKQYSLEYPETDNENASEADKFENISFELSDSDSRSRSFLSGLDKAAADPINNLSTHSCRSELWGWFEDFEKASGMKHLLN